MKHKTSSLRCPEGTLYVPTKVKRWVRLCWLPCITCRARRWSFNYYKLGRVKWMLWSLRISLGPLLLRRIWIRIEFDCHVACFDWIRWQVKVTKESRDERYDTRCGYLSILWGIENDKFHSLLIHLLPGLIGHASYTSKSSKCPQILQFWHLFYSKPCDSLCSNAEKLVWNGNSTVLLSQSITDYHVENLSLMAFRN